jgi:hypothetical protein
MWLSRIADVASGWARNNVSGGAGVAAASPWTNMQESRVSARRQNEIAANGGERAGADGGKLERGWREMGLEDEREERDAAPRKAWGEGRAGATLAL